MKEIIINKEKEKKQILLLENNELIEKYTESDKIKRGRICDKKCQRINQRL